jgi:3-methyl-2-oxobutanoate hydroxymethyltransferase
MNEKKKVTVPRLVSLKKKQKKIVMVTAYDAAFAGLVDKAGVDMVLVGDTLGMVVQGHKSTLPVTLEDIIYHTRAVSRGLTRAHLTADMPFLTAKVSAEQALIAAGKLMQQGRAESVKLEGGTEVAETVKTIVDAGIPVVGHVGLCPQSVHAMGGHRIQGKRRADQVRILEDALAVAEAGAFCLVLEGIPMELAETVTSRVDIPTVGIGAGPGCDGQVLVIYDLLGITEDFTPRFLKRYAEVGAVVRDAVSRYAEETRRGEFPSREHCFSISDSESVGGRLVPPEDVPR